MLSTNMQKHNTRHPTSPPPTISSQTNHKSLPTSSPCPEIKQVSTSDVPSAPHPCPSCPQPIAQPPRYHPKQRNRWGNSIPNSHIRHLGLRRKCIAPGVYCRSWRHRRSINPRCEFSERVGLSIPSASNNRQRRQKAKTKVT